jgi:hypothetical protein
MAYGFWYRTRCVRRMAGHPPQQRCSSVALCTAALLVLTWRRCALTPAASCVLLQGAAGGERARAPAWRDGGAAGGGVGHQV